MKFWSFILAIFTLGLTLFPCEDEQMVSTASKSVVQESHKHGHERHDGIDYCNPFCICAVNHSKEDNSVIIEEPVVQNSSELKSFYASVYAFEIIDDIFQPPQV